MFDIPSQESSPSKHKTAAQSTKNVKLLKNALNPNISLQNQLKKHTISRNGRRNLQVNYTVPNDPYNNSIEVPKEEKSMINIGIRNAYGLQNKSTTPH